MSGTKFEQANIILLSQNFRYVFFYICRLIFTPLHDV